LFLAIIKQRLDRIDAKNRKYNYWLKYDCEYVEKVKLSEKKDSEEATIIRKLFSFGSLSDLKEIKSMIV
jgi:hypothetical protein